MYVTVTFFISLNQLGYTSQVDVLHDLVSCEDNFIFFIANLVRLGINLIMLTSGEFCQLIWELREDYACRNLWALSLY